MYPESHRARELFEASLGEIERLGGQEGVALAAAFRMIWKASQEFSLIYPGIWRKERRNTWDLKRLRDLTGETEHDLRIE